MHSDWPSLTHRPALEGRVSPAEIRRTKNRRGPIQRRRLNGCLKDFTLHKERRKEGTGDVLSASCMPAWSAQLFLHCLKPTMHVFWASQMAQGGEESACKAGDTGDLGSIPGLGRSPGRGHDNPLQCSCLEKSRDRGAWWATVHGVTKSQTRLNEHTHSGILLPGYKWGSWSSGELVAFAKLPSWWRKGLALYLALNRRTCVHWASPLCAHSDPADRLLVTIIHFLRGSVLFLQ